MKDEYGRKLQCPKCNSKKICFVKGSKGKNSELLYCESCGMIGNVFMFRAIPSSENPSRRDSDLEDPKEPKARTIRVPFGINEKALKSFQDLEICPNCRNYKIVTDDGKKICNYCEKEV